MFTKDMILQQYSATAFALLIILANRFMSTESFATAYHRHQAVRLLVS